MVGEVAGPNLAPGPAVHRAPPVNKLKILFLQDHARHGGAARAAVRWARLLQNHGHATTVVAGDESEAGGHRLTGKPSRGWGRLQELLTAGRGRRQEKVRREFAEILQREQPDLIWCHNLAGGQKWGWGEFLVSLARDHGPVLWTLHDMWALGENDQAYWDEAEKAETGSGRGEREGKAKASKVGRVAGVKKNFPFLLATPSKWLRDLTEKITGQVCLALPNPIDLDLYRPGDRWQARKRLGLPEEGFLILAGADSLRDRRKGLDLLQAAWAAVRPRNSVLVLFGRHEIAGGGTLSLGPIDSDARMIDAYQAADLYVHPARIENASCQIQEAMACGIPALAFSTGGNPELVRPGESGFLAGPVSAEGLTAELGRALQTGPGLQAMGQAARKQALTIWDSRRLARAWEEAVEPLFTARPPSRSRG